MAKLLSELYYKANEQPTIWLLILSYSILPQAVDK